jgi:hypothetical protein
VRRKSVIAASLPIRRGLDENEAAVYLSFSPSFFRKLVAAKQMPRPRLAGGRRIWGVFSGAGGVHAAPEADGAGRDLQHGRRERPALWYGAVRLHEESSCA